MLQITPQGDEKYLLIEGAGRVVGWIRGASIRIGAFPGERAAVDAAAYGARVLEDYLRGGIHRPRPFVGRTDDVRTDDVRTDVGLAAHEGSDHPGTGAPSRPERRLVHDGAYEWVVVGRRPVARLIRPGALASVDAGPGATRVADGARELAADAPPSTRAFALEFVVPAAVPPTMRVTLARVLHRALAHPDATDAGARLPSAPHRLRTDVAPDDPSTTAAVARWERRPETPTAARTRAPRVRDREPDPTDRPPPAA